MVNVNSDSQKFQDESGEFLGIFNLLRQSAFINESVYKSQERLKEIERTTLMGENNYTAI